MRRSVNSVSILDAQRKGVIAMSLGCVCSVVTLQRCKDSDVWLFDFLEENAEVDDNIVGVLPYRRRIDVVEPFEELRQHFSLPETSGIQVSNRTRVVGWVNILFYWRGWETSPNFYSTPSRFFCSSSIFC